MFLFTTPPEPAVAPARPAIVRSLEPAVPAGAPAPVVSAIRQGAERTGTDFGYLLSTARRESAFDPAAKAPTSSATGLFQFIEQTWLGLIKSEGEKIGLARYADAISPRQGGGFTVDDGGTKSEILKLREDPALASVMAGTLTQQNRDALAASTGRDPRPGELYMAHLLGARGATDLIRSAEASPGRAAALDLPDAAAANRSIFYDRDGRPRGAGEVYALLSSPQGTAAGSSGAPAAAPVPASASPATPSGDGAATALFKPDGPVLYSLFQTENRPSPASGSLARMRRANTQRSDGAVAVAFFPSASGGSSGIRDTPAAALPAAASPIAIPANAAPPSSAAALTALAHPLPPPRPTPTDLQQTHRVAPGRAARLASK